MRKENSLKKRIKQGEVVFGPWCVLPSPSVINIIGAAGMDFVILDLEHGASSFETLEEMVRSAESENCCPLVRVGKRDELHILKALDLGAHGVLVPHVSDKKEAAEAVSFAKYYPEGQRGFSPFTRTGGYGMLGIQDHAKKENEETIVAVILEGIKGLEHLDEILDVPNIDLIYIGAYDLSQSLGIPGQVNHKKVKGLLEKNIKKIRDNNKAAGGHVAKNADDFRWMVNCGMQFITCLPDTALIFHAFHDLATQFREIRQDSK